MSSKARSKASKDHLIQQSLFILHYKSRRVLIATPKDYDQLQDSIWGHFPEIPPDHRVSYHTNELHICKGTVVEVSKDAWKTAIPLLSTLTVQAEPKAPIPSGNSKRPMRENNGDASSCHESDNPKPPAKKPRRNAPLSSTIPQPAASHSPPLNPSANEALTLRLVTASGKELYVRCSPSTRAGTILSQAVAKLELDPNQEWRALWGGTAIAHTGDSFGDSETVGSLGIEHGETIDIMLNQKGGKPVIYLFPPAGSEVDASVTLSLVPQWHFSAVYPVVPIRSTSSGGQTLQWDVKASPDGTLLERNTGLEAAYLFWEAEALALGSKKDIANSNLNAEPKTPTKLGGDVETFVPTQAELDPTNSVVLMVANMTPYLDSALKALGLHTEARTSFITYWLPSFLKHTHIAIRFLPQRAYERAAPLQVTPAPDVVVRVFMLFKGLSTEEVAPGSAWYAMRGEVGGKEPEMWRSVVGVNESQRLNDTNVFRVVEWGGMEVLS